MTDRIRKAPPQRFRRYSQYKDSGVEWLGEIPAHWEVRRLKFVTHTVAGQSPPSVAVTDRMDGTDGLPFLQGNAEFGPLSPKPQKVCDSAPKRAEPGDILLSVRAPVGAMNVADQPYGIGRGLCAIRPAAGLDRSFCFYEVMAMRPLLDAVATGSTYDAVTSSDVGDLLILLPHQGEQHAIADFLDRETAKIDGLVARKERLIELLQEKRTALITRTVTRGLDPDVPMKDSGVKWLGDIPAHWEVKRLKWVAQMESGHTPDKKVAAYWNDGNIPWVSLNDTGYLKNQDYIRDTEYYTNALGLKNSSARLLPPRSVIFSRDATIGLCAITERSMAVSQHFIAWICTEALLPEYLLRALDAMQGELERLTMGATLRTIGMPDVKTLSTPVPPVPEQDQIITFVRKETAFIDALIAKVLHAIDLLKEFRTALISAAVTGKTDVREEAA